jgi:short-subunit dehydrogenase
VRLTHAALPGMITRRHGGIVNVSSVAGHQPIPLWATYSASKAFVTTFSRAVAGELKGTGVRMLVLLPGFTHTEFQDHAGFERKLVPGPAWMTPEAVAEVALRDLEHGRVHSFPGLHNRVVAAASRLSPWAVTRRVLRVATRRMW